MIYKFYPIIFLNLVFFYCCTEVPTGTKVNQLPHTYLSLFPDSTISPSKTKLKITWWGDDPDGFVAGYRISFDSINWGYTTRTDSTFQLNISGQDSTFRFWVAAVDNQGGIDPHPASNRYPVYNTPPSVIFNAGTEIPDTTFTVASFSWTGTDPDGDNTIKYFYWSLNDTNNWHKIPGTLNTLTLRQDSGIVPNSNNILYLKAQDIANAYSGIIRMPDTSRTWFVRNPVGKILLINDYFRSVPTDVQQAVTFYQGALNNRLYSYLDIKVSNGANIPKIQNPMFIETMKLFQCVVWFANRSIQPSDAANFDLAQQTIPYYLAAGGKVFFSTGFPTFITSQGNLVDFASIDSITSFAFTNISTGSSTILLDNNYPVLQCGSPAPDLTRGIYPRSGTHSIYKLPYNTPYDTTQITVCSKDATSNPHIVFMSVPLNRMNYINNASIFLQYVINNDFGITP